MKTPDYTPENLSDQEIEQLEEQLEAALRRRPSAEIAEGKYLGTAQESLAPLLDEAFDKMFEALPDTYPCDCFPRFHSSEEE